MRDYDTTVGPDGLTPAIRRVQAQDERTRLALHEAGHAVAMQQLGSGASYATVSGAAHARFRGSESPRTRAIVAMSGAMAAGDTMSEQDREILDTAVRELCRGGRREADVLDELRYEARTFVQRHEADIAAVARRLGTEGKTFGTEIADTMQRRRRSTMNERRIAAGLPPR